MDSKKNNKEYQGVLNHVLAQFDIETKVNAIALRTFEALMRGNQQAFSYLTQSHHKLEQFETRLVKSQHYYQLIEANLDTKVAIVNQVNERLQQFTTHFWKSIQETNIQTISSKKVTDEIKLQNSHSLRHIQTLEDKVNKVQTFSSALDGKIETEVREVVQQFNHELHQTNDQLKKRRDEIEDAIVKISESKALLDSKVGTLTEVLEHITLYKEEKANLSSQIELITDNLEKRVLKSDFNELKYFLDGERMTQRARITSLEKTLKVKIQGQRENSQLIAKDLNEKISKLTKVIDQKDSTLKQLILAQQKSLVQQIKSVQQSFQPKFSQIEKLLKSHQIQLQSDKKEMEGINIEVGDLQNKNQQKEEEMRTMVDQIRNLDSSLVSMNDFVTKLEQEGKERDRKQQERDQKDRDQKEKEQKERIEQERDQKGKLEDMSASKLQMSTQLQEELNGKISALRDRVINVEQQLKQLPQSFQVSFTAFKGQLTQIKQQQQQNHQQSTLKLSEQQKHHDQLCSQLSSMQATFMLKVSQTQTKVIEHLNDQLQASFEPIRSNLNELDTIITDVQKFKREFQEEIAKADQINHKVSEKVERVASIVAKLRGDLNIKIQVLAHDLQSRTSDQKLVIKSVEQLKQYLSEINELILILTSTSLWRQEPEEQEHEAFKISSLIEGWVYEADDKGKVKIRGEHLNRKKLIKMTLEYLVVMADRFKTAAVLQSGKETFAKIMRREFNEQSNNTLTAISGHGLATTRKSFSRRKSELPKLFL